MMPRGETECDMIDKELSNTASNHIVILKPIQSYYYSLQKREQWQMVFWITFFLYLAGTILFCILVSGEAQSWALQDSSDSESSLDEESL